MIEELTKHAHTIIIKPFHKSDAVYVECKATTKHLYGDVAQFDVHEIRVSAPTLSEAINRAIKRIPKGSV